jgi:hypothetical protein
MERRALLNEVLRQRAVLLDGNRTPSEIRAHVEYEYDFLRLEEFRQPWTDGLERATKDGSDGYLFGLPVYFDRQPGIRVLPDDWRGDGQGATR